MADVPLIDGQGTVWLYPEEETARLTSEGGFRHASPAELQKAQANQAREDQYGSTGQQALGLLETGVGAATLGLVPQLAPGGKERKIELERQSPFLKIGAEGVGTALPTLATGGALGAVAGAGRAARLGVIAAEGLVGGAAAEAERVRQTDEEFSGANALAFGLGGEILGRGLGAAVRGLSRKAGNVLGRIEAEANEAMAREGASGAAKAKAAALEADPVKFADEVRTQVSKNVEQLKIDELRNPVAKADLDSLVPQTAPAHTQWADDISQKMRRLVDESAPKPLDLINRASTPVADPSFTALSEVVTDLNKQLVGTGQASLPGFGGTTASTDMFRAGADAYAKLAAIDTPASRQIRTVLAEGMTDASLFGRAAQAFEISSRATDALSEDALKSLSKESLDALDQAVAARKAFGLETKDKTLKRISALQSAATDLADADAAISARYVKQFEKPESALKGVGDALGEFAQRRVKGAVQGAIGSIATAVTGSPMAGTLVSFGVDSAWGRLGKSLSAANAAKLADAARRFAAPAARAVGVTGTAAGAAGLARFTGEYSSPVEAYHARVETIQRASEDPGLLMSTIAQSTGDLAVMAPGFYKRVAATSTRALMYLRENLPVSVSASVISPRGLPPSYESIRQFANLWNAVTAPETVLQAVGDGTATPPQMRALEAVHPELYESLKASVIEQVSKNPSAVKQQTKVWLDILFESDGLAGLGYSMKAGRMFRPDPQAEQEGKGPSVPPSVAAQSSMQQQPGNLSFKHGPTLG
jgi:hypothetical protein